MRPPHLPDETRAEIARRRLAQLAASFDAQLPQDTDPDNAVAPRRLELPHIKVLVTLAVAASVLLVWWLLSGRPHASGPDEPLAFTPTNGASASPGASPGTATPTPADDLVIDVVGKVRKPGIVTVPKGSRVYEAIAAAGGLKCKVDTTSVNMARLLTDGEQILIGSAPATVPGVAAGARASASGSGAAPAKVNLNTATAEQLDTLPGVGPVTAQSILSWRIENGRFTSVEDLLDVKGIGDATLAELRDHVTV
ncbi:MAG: DNA-binding protein [Aeromicrobium sp.]|nr:DNA-binding protein [Aeromicrobium sp.]